MIHFVPSPDGAILTSSKDSARKGRQRHIFNQPNAKTEKENKQEHYTQLRISPSV